MAAAHTADEYRKQAEECLLQAERARFEGDKAAWLKIAARWQRLAEEADPAGQQAHQPRAKRNLGEPRK